MQLYFINKIGERLYYSVCCFLSAENSLLNIVCNDGHNALISVELMALSKNSET